MFAERSGEPRGGEREPKEGAERDGAESEPRRRRAREERDRDPKRLWVSLPVVSYDSYEELVDMLEATDFAALRLKMKNYSTHVRQYVHDTWSEVSSPIGLLSVP